MQYFAEIPFDSAVFIFDGGEVIRVDSTEDIERPAESAASRGVRFTLSAPNQEDVSWTPLIMDRAAMREIRRHIPSSWRQVSYDLWIDDSDDEETTTSDLISRYRVPPKVAAALQQDMPEVFSHVVKGIDCHLIETQRLLVLPTEIDPDSYYSRLRSRPRVSRLAVQQKAEKLKTILGETLARYANLSQSLDRTFPLRVFEAQGSAKLSEGTLRQELRVLDERREALMASGILDSDFRPVSLRAGNIEPGVAMALEIYVKDTVDKLDVFNDLRAKVDLFKDLISNRFFGQDAPHRSRERFQDHISQRNRCSTRQIIFWRAASAYPDIRPSVRGHRQFSDSNR
jgi:hypothetical protein